MTEDVKRCETCGDPYNVETIDEHGFCDSCRPPVIPLASGVRPAKDFDGITTQWILYRREDVSVWIRDKPYYDWETTRQREDLAQALSGWARSYGGPGRWFWHEPWMRITRSYVLVKQNGGYDI